MKELAIMVLANGIYANVITQDQAIDILKAMDNSSDGDDTQLDQRAKEIQPILDSLIEEYVMESKS